MARIKQRLLSLSILLIGLGLCLPLYKKMYRAYTQSNNDHIKPGFELPQSPKIIVETEVKKLKTIKYGSFENQLELKQEQPPQELANNAEVIFVSGYESKDDSASDNRIKVNIDRPGKNVLLVLSSYESIVWEVQASPDTNITGVVQGSYDPSAVITTSPTKGFVADLSYTYNLENINFVEVLKQLNKWLGIEQIDAFRGHYALPSTIAISELDTPHPSLTLAGYPVVEPANNFEFTLYNNSFTPKKWTLKGAVEKCDRNKFFKTGIAVSPNGTETYELTKEGIKVTNKETGKQKEYKVPKKFPELSWATDIAYDTKRDLVAAVSFGGEGHFYRFDAKNKRWLDVRSVNGLDITSLSYDSTSDRYIAWLNEYGGDTFEGTLLLISGTGKLLSSEYVSDKMPELYRLYDSANGLMPLVKLAAQGNNLALIAYKHDILEPIGSTPQAIWHYNLESKTMQLTYKFEQYQ